jgi:hypothetical protein
MLMVEQTNPINKKNQVIIWFFYAIMVKNLALIEPCLRTGK